MSSTGKEHTFGEFNYTYNPLREKCESYIAGGRAWDSRYLHMQTTMSRLILRALNGNRIKITHALEPNRFFNMLPMEVIDIIIQFIARDIRLLMTFMLGSTVCNDLVHKNIASLTMPLTPRTWLLPWKPITNAFAKRLNLAFAAEKFLFEAPLHQFKLGNEYEPVKKFIVRNYNRFGQQIKVSGRLWHADDFTAFPARLGCWAKCSKTDISLVVSRHGRRRYVGVFAGQTLLSMSVADGSPSPRGSCTWYLERVTFHWVDKGIEIVFYNNHMQDGFDGRESCVHTISYS